MTRSHHRRQGKPALELIEEGVHLLRTAPVATLAVYFAGTIPFVLGALYFWADMSRSPFASQHLAEGAFGVALLFFWMKFCQTIFARRLRARIAGAPPPRWTIRQCRRMLTAQTLVQPTALFALPVAIIFLMPLEPRFILPLALVLLAPFGWLYAFYQSVTALDDGESERNRTLIARAWKQACLWPQQNFLVLGAVGGFGLFVFLNWIIVTAAVPKLLKMFFGIESVFTQSPNSLFNTTFFTAMLGLTFLCVDPILKTIYVLRCFYGESLRSGEDLKAEVKQFAPAAAPLAAVLVVLLALAIAPSVHAAEAGRSAPDPGRSEDRALEDAGKTGTAQPATMPAPGDGRTPAPAFSAPELDRAIDKTIQERKYTWRMPREQLAEPAREEGAIAKFLRKVARMIRSFFDWLGELLRKLFPQRQTSVSAPGEGWITSLHILLYAVIAAVVIALAILLLRVWRHRRKIPDAVATEAVQPVPDLADENVGADQLPEDGWTRLARELLERGEFRLAMRAFYLASLAHLANRNLISLARFKSNRDYALELHRRGHSFPDLLSVFGENISVFERIWYGVHDVNRDLVDRFAANVERIRGAG